MKTIKEEEAETVRRTVQTLPCTSGLNAAAQRLINAFVDQCDLTDSCWKSAYINIAFENRHEMFSIKNLVFKPAALCNGKTETDKNVAAHSEGGMNQNHVEFPESKSERGFNGIVDTIGGCKSDYTPSRATHAANNPSGMVSMVLLPKKYVRMEVEDEITTSKDSDEQESLQEQSVSSENDHEPNRNPNCSQNLMEMELTLEESDRSEQGTQNQGFQVKTKIFPAVSMSIQRPGTPTRLSSKNKLHQYERSVLKRPANKDDLKMHSRLPMIKENKTKGLALWKPHCSMDSNVGSRKCSSPSDFQKKKLRCKICGLKYKYANNLSQHVDISHRQTPRFICRICNKAFVSQQSLGTHTNIHSDKC